MEIHSIEFTTEKHPRYDGHFYRAILTTGIFCRPICPSRPARAENVLFFSTAAAAAEAGFRPCLRCRPESAPDRPEGVGVTRLVRHALRLIAEDVQGDALAARLHLSSRQLRRRFVQELGAPPVAIVQTRKLLFAKKLLDETQLPMTEVAFSAGYSSVRRFNAAIRQTYDRTPTEIRNSRRNRRAANLANGVTLKLFFRPPFNWSLLSQQLQARALPQIEQIDADMYRRVVRFGEDVGVVTVTPFLDDNYLLLHVPDLLSRHLLTITERCKRLFDLRTDPAFVSQNLRDDPLLADLLAQQAGVRLVGAWDAFETVLQTILERPLLQRLIASFGDVVAVDQQLTRLFPTPVQLISADIAQIGIPAMQTIRVIARAWVAGEPDWFSAETLSQTIAILTAIDGIDNWTAHMLAMRVMGEGDAFPAGDLALRQAVTPPNSPLISTIQLTNRAEAWRPWRAYAANLLWTKTNETNAKNGAA